MDRRKVSTVLKVVALIMMLISLIVSLVTLIGGTTSTVSNAVALLTLLFGWILYGVDKIFVDNEEEDF